MFHLRDGFHFERIEDGSVHIRYSVPVVHGGGLVTDEQAIIAEVTVPENEWASLLAAVCSMGSHLDGRTYSAGTSADA